MRPVNKPHSNILDPQGPVPRKSSIVYTSTEVHNLAPSKKPDSQMKGKTGEWGEGPAGATVPYDVRGLHAAQGAIWTAPLGDNRSKLKNKTRESAIVPKKTCTGP